MKQYFIIETTEGVSKTIVTTALRIFLEKELIKVSYLKPGSHTVASLNRFVYKK